MLKVGISGKIASGKTEVESILRRLKYPVFDMDVIVHNLYEFENVKKAILEEFQTLDRKKIADIVFKDYAKKEKLEKIIYPELEKEIFNIFDKYKNEKIIFISAALLFKSGFYRLFDKTIFINASDEIRLERLMKRNNIDENNAKKRLNLQDDGVLADYIIENNSAQKDLEDKVQKIINQILK